MAIKTLRWFYTVSDPVRCAARTEPPKDAWTPPAGPFSLCGGPTKRRHPDPRS
ncbi:conserved hypothetical protein [Streptomyces sp. C]|nr:conserved hypothetical protein [Streptomyces sp. C]